MLLSGEIMGVASFKKKSRQAAQDLMAGAKYDVNKFYVKLSLRRLIRTIRDDEANFKLKLPGMPLFSCGAIPQAFSCESPAEKMHAHVRSFSSYHR